MTDFFSADEKQTILTESNGTIGAIGQKVQQGV